MTLHHKTEAVFEHLKICARAGHVITYGDLGRAVRWGHRNLGPPLFDLQDACRELNLPPITALVVLRRTGLPSDGYQAPDGRYEREVHEAVKREISEHDWSTVSMTALRDAVRGFRRDMADGGDMIGDDAVTADLPNDLPTDDEVRAHATVLGQMYTVAYAAASGEVAGAAGAPDLLRTAHEIALMTVRRFHELEMASSKRFDDATP